MTEHERLEKRLYGIEEKLNFLCRKAQAFADRAMAKEIAAHDSCWRHWST